MNHKYRKRPVVIEAFQMTTERRGDTNEWPEWLHEARQKDHGADGELAVMPSGKFAINTLEGKLLVSWDDWIIRGVEGELYPCKPDIFEKTYEPVKEGGE